MIVSSLMTEVATIKFLKRLTSKFDKWLWITFGMCSLRLLKYKINFYKVDTTNSSAITLWKLFSLRRLGEMLWKLKHSACLIWRQCWIVGMSTFLFPKSIMFAQKTILLYETKWQKQAENKYETNFFLRWLAKKIWTVKVQTYYCSLEENVR